MSKRKGKLTSLESLIPRVSQKMGIESRLRELMIMNYWSEIAQGEIGKESKPHSLKRTKDGALLYVGAKSSMVAQELNIVKLALLDKLNLLASQLGFRIKDIVISTKYWTEDSDNDSIEPSKINTIKEINDKEFLDIESVEISEDQKKEIEKNLSLLDFDDDLKKRMKSVMEKDLKIKKIKEERGFPVCKRCGVRLVNYNDEFCPSCNPQ